MPGIEAESWAGLGHEGVQWGWRDTGLDTVWETGGWNVILLLPLVLFAVAPRVFISFGIIGLKFHSVFVVPPCLWSFSQPKTSAYFYSFTLPLGELCMNKSSRLQLPPFFTRKDLGWLVERDLTFLGQICIRGGAVGVLCNDKWRRISGSEFWGVPDSEIWKVWDSQILILAIKFCF